MALRVAFFGTPDFAVPTLERLHASSHIVAGVITQPDRPRGRGHKLTPSPVKAVAVSHGLTVLQPERIRSDEFMQAFRELRADLGVVAAYGKLLPANLLAIPRMGMVNVHASLLPRWRGAAPIHRAVMAGDRETGVTIMRVVEALDAGPMLAHVAVPIGPDATSADVERSLADVGARLLVETLDRLGAGEILELPQDESLVTYAKRLERAESQVDWARPAAAVHNQIRGLQPWPLAAAVLHGKRLLLLRSDVASDDANDAPPGTVIAVEPDALVVATAPGAIRLRDVQPDGRAAMPVRAFLSGHRVQTGDVFTAVPVRHAGG